MRNLLIPSLLAFSVLSGCSKEEAPALPAEYIRMKYQLTPGSGSGDAPLVLTARAETCDRASRRLVVKAYRRSVGVILTLQGANTMPGQKTANRQTMGQVQMDFVVPQDPNTDMTPPVTVGFTTIDPAFTCTIRSSGEDPFTQFKATFSCDGAPTANGTLTVSDGEIIAGPCPPQ